MSGQPAASHALIRVASMLSTVPIPTFIFEVGCLLVVCRFMVPSVKRVARHVPVLLGQVVRFMVGESPITGRGVFVDATFGSGGHSKSLLGQLTNLRIMQSSCRLCHCDRQLVVVLVR